jgi:hypothetical protein
MNQRSDVERVLSLWLADGPSIMPDRVVDVVADRISRERQRRRLPWRHNDMTLSLKLVAAIAAVLVIAVVAWAVLPPGRSPGVGGQGSTPSPESSSRPSATPLTYRWPGALAAGTYTTSLVWDVPFTFTFTVPGGWEGYDIEISRAGDPTRSVEFVLVDNVFADPCATTAMDPAVGSSVAALADAVGTIPGLDMTEPTPIDLDGATSGVELGYVLRVDAGCAPATFSLWDLSEQSFIAGAPQGGARKDLRASEGRMRILDVDGVRVVVRMTWEPSATGPLRDELQAIFDSIQISGPGPSPAPQPAP